MDTDTQKGECYAKTPDRQTLPENGTWRMEGGGRDESVAYTRQGMPGLSVTPAARARPGGILPQASEPTP